MRTWFRLWLASIVLAVVFCWPWAVTSGSAATVLALAWAPFGILLLAAVTGKARLTSVSHGAATPPVPAPRRRVPLAPEVKAGVWVRDGGRCRSCRVTDDSAMALHGEHLQFDHVIPWSLGGSDEEENIQLLCGPCNRAKGAIPGGTA